MTIKTKFQKTFAYTWYLYLLAIVIPCICFPLAYSFMHRAQEFEKLSLFLSNTIEDSSKLEKNLLEKFKEKGVKKIDITSYDASGNVYMYSQKLSVVGLNRSDVLIIPNSKIGEINLLGSMIGFNEDIKNRCNSVSESYYSYEGIDYGLKISKTSYITNYVKLSESEDYYLFLGGNSWNVGEYSTKAMTTTNAFELVKYLIGK